MVNAKNNRQIYIFNLTCEENLDPNSTITRRNDIDMFWSIITLMIDTFATISSSENGLLKTAALDKANAFIKQFQSVFTLEIQSASWDLVHSTTY